MVVSVQAYPFTGCINLDKLLLNHPEPQSHYMQNGDNTSTHFTDFLREVNEKMYSFHRLAHVVSPQ